MRRHALIILPMSVAVSFAVVFGARLRGTFMGGGLQFVVAIYCGGSAVVASVLCLGLYRVTRKGNYLNNAGTAFIIAVGLALPLVTVPAGRALLKRDIAAAREYCDALVASEVLHKDDSGLYPKRQDDLALPRPVPRLLRKQTFYSPTRGREEFTLAIRYGFDLRLEYRSARTPHWAHRS